MLAARARRLFALALAGALIAGAATVPATDAKEGKKPTPKVGGTLQYTVPGFDPNTDQSLAPGLVRAKKGCQALRVLRFAYFGTDGVTPLPNTDQPSVVSSPSGSFVVALREPFVSDPPQTIFIRGFAEPRTVFKKGKKVKCKPIFGPGVPVTVVD